MEITTPRLILRDFTAEDLPAFLAYQSDPRHAEFYGPQEIGTEHARSLLEKFRAWAAESPRRNYQLAIVRLVQGDDSQELIGSCGVRLQGGAIGMAEFGLQLAPESWGPGFATEAARAILSYAFRDLDVHEVRGVTVTENTRVQRLVARLGFTKVASNGVYHLLEWQPDEVSAKAAFRREAV